MKAVFLIGDPQHKAGLACNVDNNGKSTTKNVNGLSAFGASGVPDAWVGKTLDVCIYVSLFSFLFFFSSSQKGEEGGGGGDPFFVLVTLVLWGIFTDDYGVV